MLQDMMDKDAADLYLSVDAPPKYSLEGSFVTAFDSILSDEDTLEYAKELMDEEQYQEFQRELEINISYTLGEEGRFRVNIFTQRDHVSIVIRRIKVEIPRLEELGLPVVLGDLLMQERGLILMTGPTGSGKSTSLASMINYRNERQGGHIVTIEDPVEFIHENKECIVSQREVGIDTKSFHIALKNTLRQAPKIIYIGEIRDSETMEFALHAAETGHLVLGTLHSNNANQTLERIMNFFPQEYHNQLLLQLSLNLHAIISQRLLKRMSGGRVAALEILLNTPLISELIAQNQVTKIKHAMAEGKQEGLQTFDQHIYDLWAEGAITQEEAFKNADSTNNLRLRMKGIGAATASG